MSTSVTSLISNAPATAPSTATATGSDALGKDDFLKILVAQLANQDPTQPQDASQFVAELAQFSSLEAQQNTVTDLDSMMTGQATANQTSATSFVGMNVNYQGGTVQWDGTTPLVTSVGLSAAASNVSVAVQDASGQTVRTLQLGPNGAGNLTVAWNGLNDSGAPAAPGIYTMQPTAVDSSGKAVATSLSSTGTVTGVAFQGGVPYLEVGGGLVQMSNVTSINERNTP
jgi:flagellar basal-body rod modification protein FlgD